MWGVLPSTVAVGEAVGKIIGLLSPKLATFGETVIVVAQNLLLVQQLCCTLDAVAHVKDQSGQGETLTFWRIATAVDIRVELVRCLDEGPLWRSLIRIVAI